MLCLGIALYCVGLMGYHLILTRVVLWDNGDGVFTLCLMSSYQRDDKSALLYLEFVEIVADVLLWVFALHVSLWGYAFVV